MSEKEEEGKSATAGNQSVVEQDSTVAKKLDGAGKEKSLAAWRHAL